MPWRLHPMPIAVTCLYVGLLACLVAPARGGDMPIEARVSTVAELRRAVARLSPTAGGAIILAPGLYLLDSPLVVRGAGQVSILGAGCDRTILRRVGEGDALVFRGACNFCTVQNLRITGDGAARTGSGIRFDETDWSGLSTLDTCMVEGFAESGIRFAGRFATPQSSHLVRNCILRNNRESQIGSVSNNDFTFEFNHLLVDQWDARDACGISMEASSAGTILGCRFTGCRIGLAMGRACSMDRVTRNRFEECRDAAIDCGMETPDGFDAAKVPPEQLYVAWDWSVPHPIRMTTEAMFCWNTIVASRPDPRFVALDVRSTLYATIYGNRVYAGGPIRSVVRADRNCLQWIVRNNTLVGEAACAYDLARPRNALLGANRTMPTAAAVPGPFSLPPSDLARRMPAAWSGRDAGGRKWFRRVTTVAQLERAVREVPASGGTIFVAAGEYRLSATLAFQGRRGVTILGCGPCTVLKGVPGADLLVFSDDCRDCTVAGLNLVPDGATPWSPINQERGSAIVFRGPGRGLAVECCVLDGWPVSGVRFEGEAGNPIVGAAVSGCWIIRCRQAGLLLRNCRGFSVTGNQVGYTFEDKNPAGALLEGCADGLYQLNYHWGNRNGIVVAGGCSGLHILDNRSEQGKESGLLLESRTGAPNRGLEVSGNTFHTNPELEPGTASNVTARGTDGVRFTANQVYTWWEPRRSRHGIELATDCQGWRFEANYVRDYEGEAIHASGGRHSFVANILNSPRPK